MKTLGLCLVFSISVFGVSAVPPDKSDELREMINDLQRQVEELKVNEANAQKRIADLEAENDLVKSQVLDESVTIRRLEQVVDKAANDTNLAVESLFLATIASSSVSIEDGDPIIWDSAPINPGGNFNTALGLYQAPVHGYYTFSVTKLGNQYDGRFYFLVDEVEYAHLETDLVSVGDSTPATFATVTVELLAGQIVRIENAGSTTVYGISGGILRSWFTGHLLYVL